MENAKLNKLLELMKENAVDQVLISDPASIFYLLGKTIYPGNRLYALLIDKEGKMSLFAHQMFDMNGLSIVPTYFEDTDDCIKLLSKDVIEKGTIAIDNKFVSLYLLRLMEYKPHINYSYKPMIEAIRRIKSADEIEKMREASRLNDKSLQMLTERFDGTTNGIETAAMLLDFYKQNGADGFSFDPIIAFGAASADPHYNTDTKTVEEGDAIIFDVGCRKDLFCSDMTRTYFWKTISKEQEEVYNIVLEANKRAIDAVMPGKTFAEIDAVARDYITEKGYGKNFIHRLGHCIGMEVHEDGDVSASNKDVLKEGMIFSIEPGIYLNGKFGVRIEDLVVVTKNGAESLNTFNKELKILGK